MEILDINTIFGSFPGRHADSTAESLVEVMSRHEISHALTLSSQGIYYHDMAGNQETINACERFRSALLPVGTVNPMSFWEADDMLTQIAQTSFSMFRFFPHAQGWPLDYAPFIRIVKLLSECGKPLFERGITLPQPTRGWRLWTDSGTPILVSIERPGDASKLAKCIADYPAPVVMVGVTSETIVEAMTVMLTCEQLMLETHRITMPDGLARIRDSVGAQRIVFGSGGPALSTRAALNYVMKSSLTEDEKAAVLGGNASSIVTGGR